MTGGEGLSYYGARWYDAKLGRFLSADTIVPGPGNPQTFNRYSYVANNPLRFVDPSGHSLAEFDPGPGGGGRSPVTVPAWHPSSQYSSWNSSQYSGCFRCHAAVANNRSALTNSELAAVDYQMRKAAYEGVTNSIRVIEPIDYFMAGVNCWHSGCDPNEIGWMMMPLVSGGMYHVADNFAGAQNSARQFKLVAVNGEAVLPAPMGVNWTVIGTNDVGSTFIGNDNLVEGVAHLKAAMQHYGPGRSIAGGHGWLDGSYMSNPDFYFEDVRKLGMNNVVDANALLTAPASIRSLGGPGEIFYLNWCYSASCTIVLEHLNPP